MSRSEFIVTYDGPALQGSEMDARDLAPALLAISDLVDRTNAIFNRDRASTKVVVRASFRTGCFGIDLGVVQSYAQHAIDFFGSDGVTAAANLAGILGLAGATGTGVVHVLKKLRGRPIRRVVRVDADNVEIIVDDDHIEVEYHVLEVLRDPDARKAIEKAIYEPLNRDGIDTFAVQQDAQSAPLVINKNERHWFAAPPDPDDAVLSEDISEEPLQLVSVAFRDDNKWRVSDGVSTFYVAMLDAAYSREIELGNVRFSANDLLFVRLVRRRYLDGHGKLKTEAEIIKVLDHQAGARQYNLDIEDPRNPPDDGE